MHGIRHSSTWVLAAGVVLLALTGCANKSSVARVDLPPYEVPAAAQVAAPVPPVTVAVAPVLDARHDAVGALIGERTTIGGASMGAVELHPLPTVAMTQVLKAELAAAGFAVTDGAAPLAVTAKLRQFRIETPATLTYWDLNGAVMLELVVAGPGGGSFEARYEARCADRTYLYPSETLIAGVMAKCVRDVGGMIRGDAGLASFLRKPSP